MKKILLVFLILGLLIPVGISTGQEPNTKEDNACNEGGSMAGKCDTEWEWVCGYYLARWESNGGWSTVNNPFNDACVSLLPPRPVSVAETIAALGPTCVFFPIAIYLNFNGNVVLPTGAPFYFDATCQTPMGASSIRPFIYASDITAAQALCQSYFGMNSIISTGNPNLFACK